MGRTLRPQVALYLDADRVELLRKLSEKTGQTQQALMRQAIDEMLRRAKLLKPPPKRRP